MHSPDGLFCWAFTEAGAKQRVCSRNQSYQVPFLECTAEANADLQTAQQH